MLSSTKKSLAATYHAKLDAAAWELLVQVTPALHAAYVASLSEGATLPEEWAAGCLPLPQALKQLATSNAGAANRVEEELNRINHFVFTSPQATLDRNLRHGAKVLQGEGLCATGSAAQEAAAGYIALCQQAKEQSQRSGETATSHTYAYLAQAPANARAGSV